ncbi:MAG: DUF167 domain-containing protein, partial [Vicinamibacterales bacterium]|nr:DUF167 domain-containing protein [Vicinamibacterales bacterium]
SDTPAGAVIDLRVVPRAGRTALAGLRDGALLVRLAAPPVDGAANDALIAFLASLLDRPKRDIVLVSGGHSRAKRVRVAGLSAAAVRARLGLQDTPDAG